MVERMFELPLVGGFPSQLISASTTLDKPIWGRHRPGIGWLRYEQHTFAMRIELGTQATSIRSPEFAERLAAAPSIPLRGKSG